MYHKIYELETKEGDHITFQVEVLARSYRIGIHLTPAEKTVMRWTGRDRNVPTIAISGQYLRTPCYNPALGEVYQKRVHLTAINNDFDLIADTDPLYRRIEDTVIGCINIYMKPHKLSALRKRLDAGLPFMTMEVIYA